MYNSHNYDFKTPKTKTRCFECGAEATVVWVAINVEPETGYTDEVPLCDECWDALVQVDLRK